LFLSVFMWNLCKCNCWLIIEVIMKLCFNGLSVCFLFIFQQNGMYKFKILLIWWSGHLCPKSTCKRTLICKYTRHIILEMTILFLKNNEFLQAKPVDRINIRVSHLIETLRKHFVEPQMTTWRSALHAG